MKKLLPLLFLFLAVFSGCGEDEDDVLTLEETKAMLQGEWRLESVKFYNYIPEISYEIASSTISVHYGKGLFFARDSVSHNEYQENVIVRSSKEELKLSEREGKQYLMLQGGEHEIVRLSKDILQLFRKTQMSAREVREQTFTYKRENQ